MNWIHKHAKKLVAIILLASLIVLPITSGVLGRYVTQEENQNSARVALWGTVATAEGKLFTTKDTLGRNIVLPGESNDDGLHISIDGKPEVDGELTYELNQQNIFLGNGFWAMMKPVDFMQYTYVPQTYYVCENDACTLDEGPYDSAKTYYMLENAVQVTETNGYWPVIFTLKGEGIQTFDSALSTQNSLGTIKERMDKALSDTTFTPGEDLGKLYGLKNQTLTWKWDNCIDGTNLNTIDVQDGSATLCDACKKDRILQQLMQEYETNNTSVYVMHDATKGFVKPKAATQDGNYANNDYHLFVNFDFKLSIQQVD
ncbi:MULTISPECIES: hypothetical protein [unclassified Breznakia]|uniref:hypothetical protein n=1 Tax=unclassified Breznakia TaxID=2623764 RepID=UPI002475BF65|nr:MULTISPECIES: hypothetical protein [unclassified Breznakia]MDH6367505.1 hypothetical protein [Breznakia sp. PH1-1]MDH6404625.1 hypothetical protein [Breznakia sp. PF1-11]MDH6412334.1 hypothetical protein [Breznakia sp. PFB1-11]MDH6414672.1 hypothetical protein [Breznakia sp. PFB1-14]MDH6416933.1 hypothetical protein [Breznakia sp. PFB1-4]